MKPSAACGRARKARAAQSPRRACRAAPKCRPFMPPRKNRESDHRDHHQRAEVRLAQQQPRDEQHHREHRQQAAAEAFQHRVLARGVVRGVEHHRELHRLGGWKPKPGRSSQRRAPTVLRARTPGRGRARGRRAPRGRATAPLLPHARRDQEHGSPTERERRYAAAHQVPRRVVAGEAARFGDGDRRRIHHHQPDRGEEQRGPGRRAVVLGARRIAREDVGLAHGARFLTACANTSPRWR